MSFAPFSDPDGTPNPSAMFINAVLAAGLYSLDPTPWNVYRAISGSALVRFVPGPTSFQPGYGILLAGSDALVVFAGTVNAMQWAGHIGSAVFPVADQQTGTLGNGSFIIGEALAEPDVVAAVLPATSGTLNISGHSYGGAAGFILGTHLAAAPTRPANIAVQTFGEPYSYSAQVLPANPDLHLRIIAGEDARFDFEYPTAVDPVTFSPPPAVQLFKFGLIIGLGQAALGTRWVHRGVAWELTENRLLATGWDRSIGTRLPLVQDLRFVHNLPSVGQHALFTSYLPKAMAAWQRSARNRELQVLVPIAELYIANPFAPADNLSPSVPAATINDSFDLPALTFTDSNRLDFDNVTAQAVRDLTFSGVRTMTLLRGITTWLVEGQGFAEQWHSSNPADTYSSIQKKLASILPFRCLLSATLYRTDVPSNNPIVPTYFRISDDLLLRDVQVTAVSSMQGWATRVGNLQENLAARIVWAGSDGAQIAATYLHGVPVNSVTNPQRGAVFSGTYLTALQRYCNAVAANGFGFNTINNAPPNALGAITAVTYNATSGYYTITTTNACPQGRFTCALRGFRSCRVLNGRKSCQATGANQFLVYKQAAAHVWDNFGTAVPLEGYNNGVRFSNYVVKVPASAAPTLLTTRKLGRPFRLQVGHATRRAS